MCTSSTVSDAIPQRHTVSNPRQKDLPDPSAGIRRLLHLVECCESKEFDSDEYWECALRTVIGSLWHQVSTCKMGPAEDPEAVVDHRGKVHGITKLRIADTSIIPLPLTAHTTAPAYMIGEKIADLIKEEWKFKS
ncbi:unnamed protein product [Phyllotreta striolata]|uniref:Glucose-methanol-choline oxidoreductase C-terminal domain-containing protein n=1 Tax=Phyllotreta striolata TaxID=444603 RepID=A0A9N9U012_PHYSR|nr:unnamed protein product [Phyllotreta striolata]